MPKIRVMIIEDSRVVREMLEHLIGRDPRLTVVAAVASGEEALRRLHAVQPDVISMDIRLPGIDGLQTTQRIMEDRPTPIVVCSASVEAEDLKISMNALRAGALSVVEKPPAVTHSDYAIMAERLCTQLALMSQVHVVRQRIDYGVRFGSAGLSASAARLAPPRPRPAVRGSFRMLGIVASTGGPKALHQLLPALGDALPLPVIVVQHIAAGFLDGFVNWLDNVCLLPVTAARDGEVPRPGRIYVAPADRHLCVEVHGFRLDAGDPVSLQRPSGTVLLSSMAATLGTGALGVVLTGMGDDGARGLKDIYDAGGYTVAEHESTAVVYGMPAVAVRLGAACETLPLEQIGPRLLELVQV